MTTVEQHAQLVPTSPATFNWFGTWTARAANGDSLSGTSVGTVTFADAVRRVVVANYTSTAGSGRFANAVATFLGHRLRHTGSGCWRHVDGHVRRDDRRRIELLISQRRRSTSTLRARAAGTGLEGLACVGDMR